VQNPEPLPRPSVELTLFRVSIEAYLAVSGRRRGERFLRLMADKLASEESLAAVLSIRPSADRAAVAEATREAAAWLDRALPVFLARLGEE
jgi:hypothetical protein